MMDSVEALKVISRHRGSALVVGATSAAREWHDVSSNRNLDLPFGKAMGKASSIGLGLALARPKTRVFILDGDGSLVMNLGSLLTIANMAPPNLVHFVFENGMYRTTGGQPIPNAGKFSFAALARDAGYRNVYEIRELKELEDSMEKIIRQDGPTFACLKLKPISERASFPYPPLGETAQIISRIRAELGDPS
ncbi:MAG: thiamine pyrophosphate-dependent enzyme [Dehalococcoidales bacterium]|nr:thiamine pyrophosphate-dependent enzyme [Dehalococcoidales bacterium]